jgi:hypothetical protein
MLEVILIIVCLCLLFVIGGLLGWFLKGFGVVLNFLGHGCGYLICKIILIAFLIMFLLALL